MVPLPGRRAPPPAAGRPTARRCSRPALPWGAIATLGFALQLAQPQPLSAGVKRKAATPIGAAQGVSTVAAAAKAPTLNVLARVLKRDGDRVVIDRGSRDGLRADEARLVFHPLRTRAGETARSIDALVILASGRVVELKPDSAIVALERATGEVAVGDIGSYRIVIPPALEDDALARVAARGVRLLALDPKAPLYELADRLAAPTVDAGLQVHERVVAEIKARIDLADAAYKGKTIPEGRFHGLSLSDAFRKTTAKDVEDFLWFVDAFPGKYVGQDWVLVEVYATWIINRTPSGEPDRMERKLEPLLDRATEECSASALETCEATLREVLRQWPDHAEARKRLGSIDAIEASRRALKQQPDDHVKRYDLMVKLAGVKAWKLVVEQADVLIAKAHRPLNAAFWKAVAQGELGAFDAAIAALTALLPQVEGKPLQPLVTKRLAQLQARKAAGGKPVSTYTFADWMKEAAALEEAGDADEAQLKLLSARNAAATADELREVAAASARIGALRDLRAQCSSIDKAAKGHEGQRIEERLATIGRLVEGAGASRDKVAKVATTCLDKAADTARGVEEVTLALRLSEAAVALRPDDAALVRGATWNAWSAFDLDRALRWSKRALELDAQDHYAWHTHGMILLARGDVDGAEGAARKAAASATYAWPHVTLCKVALLRGDPEAAVAEARAALDRAPEEAVLQHHLHHALRIRDVSAEAKALEAKGADGAATAVALGKARRRMLRSTVWFELWPLVERQLAVLKGSGVYDDACKAVAEATDRSMPLALRVRAAMAAEPQTPREHMIRDRIQAESALATAPAGVARERASARLAALQVREGAFHRALATLGTLAQKAAAPEVERAAADASTAARRGLEGVDLLERAKEIRARSGASPVAEKAFAEALAAFEAIECWGQAASTAFWLAVVRAGQGRVEEALTAMEALMKRVNRYLAPLEAMDLDIIHAGLLSWRGNLEASHKAVERAIAVCEATDEAPCVESMRVRRAAAFQDEGRLADAAREAGVALAFARERRFGQLERQALFQLADIALTRGDLPQTLELGAALLAGARKAKDDNNERLALMIHGAVAMRRGDAATALGFFADVLRVGARMGDASIQAMARLFEGFTHLEAAHDDKAALPALDAAAALFSSVGDDYSAARARTSQAKAELHLGKVADARKRLEGVVGFAEGVGRRVMIAAAHVELGHLELTAKRAQEALVHAERANAIVESMDIVGQRAAALHLLGLALNATGRKDEGIEKLKTAAKLNADMVARSGGDADQQGAAGYGRSRRIFRDAIDALLAAGRSEEALEILQLSRDAALQRTFGKLRPKVKDQVARAAVEGVQDAREQAQAAQRALEAEKAKPDAERSAARLKALGEKIANSEAKARQLLFQLKRDHARVHALATQVADPGALLRGRSRLPDDAVVVATFAAENELFVFTIAKHRDRVQAYRVPVGAAELRADILAWRNAVEKKTPKQSALGRKLYDRLLAPIEADLAGAKTVLIVPSGPLFYLPFGALEPPKGKVKYAVERWRFATIVGETVVVLQGPAAARRWTSFAAFANPDGSLPGAQAEVEKLASDVLRGAKVFFGDRVIADAVRDVISQARVLHFATHGVLAGSGPESYLQLAGGKLTLDDIAGLELIDQVDLVVLSACQTAVAIGETAEEGFSIADTFSRAGVPTLVASLWSVPDDATSELMVRFYKALRGGKVSRAEALQRAQVELLHLEVGGRRPFANPIHWAAFGLLGDPR